MTSGSGQAPLRMRCQSEGWRDLDFSQEGRGEPAWLSFSPCSSSQRRHRPRLPFAFFTSEASLCLSPVSCEKCRCRGIKISVKDYRKPQKVHMFELGGQDNKCFLKTYPTDLDLLNGKIFFLNFKFSEFLAQQVKQEYSSGIRL